MKYLCIILVICLFSSCADQREQEIGKIAEEIKKSIISNDFTYLNQLVSYEQIMEKAFVRLHLPYKTMKASVKRIQENSSLSDYLFHLDYSSTMRVISHNDEKITLAIHQDSFIVNYIDLIIEPVKEELKIVDFYMYQQGFSYSDEMQAYATVITKDPNNINNFRLFLKQIRMINIALLRNDVLTAKYYFKSIKDAFRDSPFSESMHITFATYDLNTNVNAILDKYAKEQPNQIRHATYLKVMKNMYRYDCKGIKENIETLWQHTGVDSLPLQYYHNCLEAKGYFED